MQRVGNDLRTHGDYLLGVHRSRIFDEVIRGGQADFDVDWVDDDGHTLTGSDRALLYAYFNQKGHLEELSTAMAMLVSQATMLENPLVLDLGCGPCTAGPRQRVDLYTSSRQNENGINVLEPGVTVLNKESVKGQEFDPGALSGEVLASLPPESLLERA